jgi:hypothetical protein
LPPRRLSSHSRLAGSRRTPVAMLLAASSPRSLSHVGSSQALVALLPRDLSTHSCGDSSRSCEDAHRGLSPSQALSRWLLAGSRRTLASRALIALLWGCSSWALAIAGPLTLPPRRLSSHSCLVGSRRTLVGMLLVTSHPLSRSHAASSQALVALLPRGLSPHSCGGAPPRSLSPS